VRLLPVLGVGRDEWVCAGLADALAGTGERVMLIDQGDGACIEALGPRPRQDLAALASGRSELADAISSSSAGVQLCLAGDIFKTAAAEGISADAFFGAFAHAPEPVDLVLVHVTRPAPLLKFFDREAEILLASSAESGAVRAAYCNVKRTCARQHRYRLVVYGVSDAARARQVHERFARTNERFLGVSPRLAGHLVGAGKGSGCRGGTFTQLAAQIVQWRLAEFASPDAVRSKRATTQRSGN
jgi:hypothetical protein